MSREGSRDHGVGEPEVLEIIREECSPAISSVNLSPCKAKENAKLNFKCDCLDQKEDMKTNENTQDIEKMLQKKEEELTKQFKEHLQKEIDSLSHRANFILQNEQVRSSYMLREAHRERQEKISALQSQLECKNLAGLMFVMCTERRKSQLERLRIIEEYNKYIQGLQDLLTEAQSLILNLSRGYKTARRVDNEWRNKMTKVLSEFVMFIHDYVKGTPETEQFFLDLPALLKCDAPIFDDLNEDPCEEEVVSEEIVETEQEEKPWYEKLEGDCRPFVMFGDMADFKPDRRRAVIRSQKYAKTAPRVWKEYVFNETFLSAECPHLDTIKDEYLNRVPQARWECMADVPDTRLQASRLASGVTGAMSMASINRRPTASASLEYKGNMGSILKIITSNNVQATQQANAQTKAMLLGARDSIEILSNSKLRERHKSTDPTPVTLNIGSRRASIFEPEQTASTSSSSAPSTPESGTRSSTSSSKEPVDDVKPSISELKNLHHDSLTVIASHKHEKDHTINYEKICPMEKCQRRFVDSFMRSLPPYMRSNPFTHFEQTFEKYEACSPEQLEILKERIMLKKKQEKVELHAPEPSVLGEWGAPAGGVAVAAQTSFASVTSALPPCTCRDPATPEHTEGLIYNLEDLIPMKIALNTINKECFYDQRIEFDRFKVIGQNSRTSLIQNKPKGNRLREITKVLKKHPSLLEIFQGNTQ